MRGFHKPSHLLMSALSLIVLALAVSQCNLDKPVANQSVGTLAPAHLADLVPIPAGSFLMGEQSGEPMKPTGNQPVHAVQLSAFYMGKYLVTMELWTPVREWGLTHGYADLCVGESKAKNHPVVNISWYDVVKWCNARSEMEGLTACYTVSGVVYRKGNGDRVVCNWKANGYRLPTEAEWEKAARGGLIGQNFPWGNTINQTKANYTVKDEYEYTPHPGYHPIWGKGWYPFTSPVGSFAPNGYGLYDMAGNVHEWCWGLDYDYTADPQTDPHGPDYHGQFDNNRMCRGGDFDSGAAYCRVARRISYSPRFGDHSGGFRLVRSRCEPN